MSVIAETLTDLQRWTGGRKKGTGIPNTEWTPNAVRTIARSEKYVGDVVARKTWTPDFHTHKSRKNRGNKNKYYQANHHEAIIPRAIWNAVQRILNSNRYRSYGTYLPMRVVDHGVLCGFISMNRQWAGFPVEEYERVASIAMGLAEGTLESDLGSEELPDGGYPIHALTGESGILRIARHLTREEQRLKAEMEGKTLEPEVPKVKPGFQVVDASMFSHSYDPVVRFTRSSVAFNSTCISRMNRCLADRPVRDINRFAEWPQVAVHGKNEEVLFFRRRCQYAAEERCRSGGASGVGCAKIICRNARLYAPHELKRSREPQELCICSALYRIVGIFLVPFRDARLHRLPVGIDEFLQRRESAQKTMRQFRNRTPDRASVEQDRDEFGIRERLAAWVTDKFFARALILGEVILFCTHQSYPPLPHNRQMLLLYSRLQNTNHLLRFASVP